MTPEIHPDAAKSFDERAELLASKLSDREVPRSSGRSPYDRLHAPDQVLVEGPVTREVKDLTGDQGMLVTSDSTGALGLYAKDYVELHRLAEAIQRSKNIRDSMSVSFVRDQVFAWLKDRRRVNVSMSMTSALIAAAVGSIGEQEIWLPVQDLLVETDFQIGEVEICTIPKSLFDASEESARSHLTATADDKAILLQWVEKQRRQFQGRAAVVVKVQAEPNRATELALDRADAALGILRLFAMANYRASETSTCATVGQSLVPERQYFFVKAGRIDKADRLYSEVPSIWTITSKDLSDFRKMSLTVWSDLLKNPTRSELQTAVLDAALLYTRGALERDLSNRLVYQFAGLESLLLADGNESIVQNLSERLAFALEETPDARAEVIGAVKAAYNLRSGFVHHGRAVGDQMLFDRFASHAWQFMVVSLPQNLHLPTKGALIKALERVKLS